MGGNSHNMVDDAPNTLFSSLPPFPEDVPHAPLPVIQLDKLAKENAEESQRLFEACMSMGFFYLELGDSFNGQRLLKDAENIFDLGPQFADTSREERLRCTAQHDVLGYRGQEHIPGGNRTFGFNLLVDDCLKSDKIGETSLRYAPKPHHDNQATFCSFTQHCNVIGNHILTHLERSLHLPPGRLTQLHQPADPRPSSSYVSFLTTKPAEEGQNRTPFNAHTDHGTLTFVFHRVLGGLQILPPQPIGTTATATARSRWTYVRPRRGCIIVNMGDTAYQFSSGVLRSAVHRVMTPPGEQAKHTRYSLAYFHYTADECVIKDFMAGNPEAEALVQQVKGTRAAEIGELDEVMNEPMNMKQWINRRMITGMPMMVKENGKFKAMPAVWGKKQRELVEVAELDDSEL